MATIETGMSAVQAMKLSSQEDRIVHMRYSAPLAADLFADCDGDTESGDVHEYWGSDWRVHLHAKA